mgnify:FL=1
MMRWDIIDELPVLNVEAWSKDLDRGIGYHVSLRPCSHEEGWHGWALIHSGDKEPESVLAVWWHPTSEPDWLAEIDDCEIDLEEIGLDKADLEEINEFLRGAF